MFIRVTSQPDLERCRRYEPHVALRERDADAALRQQMLDPHVQIVIDPRLPARVADPRVQAELQCALAEPLDQSLRGGSLRIPSTVPAASSSFRSTSAVSES